MNEAQAINLVAEVLGIQPLHAKHQTFGHNNVGMRELFYVEELKRLWKLTAEQEQVLALYSAGMALDFARRFSDAETSEWNTRMLTAIEQWLNTSTGEPDGV